MDRRDDGRTVHAEVFVSMDSGQRILVRCDCPKGFDHAYERPLVPWAARNRTSRR
jgi:hypothetical protein